MKARGVLLLGLLVLIAACAGRAGARPATGGHQPESTTLTVFAASSLAEALAEIGERFEAENPGVEIAFNFAGSQQLVQQLVHGASADIFASANEKQMDVAIQAGRVAEDEPQTFARNRLVVIYPADNPAGMRSLADLAMPGLRLVLAAPEVPAGQYALEALDRMGKDVAFGPQFQADVLANVVSYEENVRVVLRKVMLGEADAGIVYTSDAAQAGDGVQTIEIPDALNIVAAYPIAVVAGSANAAMARAFVDALLSPEGRAILASHGFMPAAH